MDVFFVCGAAKSGTTWLQRILDAHPETRCSGEGHFITRFSHPASEVIRRLESKAAALRADLITRAVAEMWDTKRAANRRLRVRAHRTTCMALSIIGRWSKRRHPGITLWLRGLALPLTDSVSRALPHELSSSASAADSSRPRIVPIVVRHKLLAIARAVDGDARPPQIVIRFTEAAIANERCFGAHGALSSFRPG